MGMPGGQSLCSVRSTTLTSVPDNQEMLTHCLLPLAECTPPLLPFFWDDGPGGRASESVLWKYQGGSRRGVKKAEEMKGMATSSLPIRSTFDNRVIYGIMFCSFVYCGVKKACLVFLILLLY